MSTDHHPIGRDIPTGIGLGLRARVLKQIEAGQAEGKIAFVELSPENYMHRGGCPAAATRDRRAAAPGDLPTA